MCGIAGVIGASISRSTVETMIQSLKHRGPDGEGFFHENDVALLHTRLSILDVSANGAQPMHSADGRYIIVFNGEVYNHKELRKKYLSHIQFKSDSDTETILYLYTVLGEQFVSLLRGMFAFIIYDTLTNIAFGARDRMGIKPFLYAIHNSIFVFASELGAIKSSGILANKIETKAVRQLFLYGSIQFPYSLIEGVFSMPPAHFFYYTKGKITVKPYWEFPTIVDKRIELEQAKKQFAEIYQEAVELRLLSDRKVGVFLSAGIDSVSILAALKKLHKTDVETFTIGFTQAHYKFISEADQAKKLATHFGFENIAKLVNTNHIQEDVLSFMKRIDQPSIDGFNTYLVSKESQSILTVALSGLGGDELMLGYPRNVNLYNKIRSSFKLSSSISDKLLLNQLYSPTNSKLISRLLKYGGNPSNLKLHYWSSRLINKPWYVNNGIFQKELALAHEEDMADFYQFDSQQYQGDLFNTISYYEMRTYMMSQLLRDMDVASMANGIEVRFPMIDHKLVEFLFSLPSNIKYNPQKNSKDNQTGKMTYSQSGVKFMLAQAYYDQWPDGFLDTKKQGFQLPIYDWFNESVKEKLADNLSDKNLEHIGFERSMLLQLKDSLYKGEFSSNHYLMNILLATI